MKSYSIVPTIYGNVLIAINDNQNLIAFLFLSGDEPKMIQLFRSKFPDARQSTSPHFTQIAQNVLNGKPTKFELHGTDFQKSVWNELLKLKTACTYQDIANSINHPKAVRAVANAVANNLLHVVVPCHLVIRSTGNIGKYAGGVEIKKALLEKLSK